jgi:hypothetical protein
MIARQPYLPRFMAGGPGNPLGARAHVSRQFVYRIHGTNAPSNESAVRVVRLHPAAPTLTYRRAPTVAFSLGAKWWFCPQRLTHCPR